MEQISRTPEEVLYAQISAAERSLYEAANENLSLETYLQQIDDASHQLMGVAQYIFVDSVELSTLIPKRFFNYAVEGIPYFSLTYQGEEVGENYHADFGGELNAFIAYNELFTCLSESMGGTQPAYGMKVVLNMFFARLKLDAALYSGEETFLSIAEVALLARMKEKSVRNFAHRELGAEHNADSRITLIRATKARQWLLSRRKFKPGMALKTAPARQVLVEIYNSYCH
ncbi:MAG: hypothetical protein CMQ34_02830 [Gammaproteobacteria bacterium]|nr:hypothetical protein [Gammaproteobacteria bacterium]